MAYDRKDHFYQEAKKQGYRSRAAFKLKELQKKFNLIRQGDVVLDLGAWPGGWLQVAAEFVGPQGQVVGVDLVEIDPLPELPHVTLLVGDLLDPAVQQQVIQAAGRPPRVVLSDMSPKLSGIRDADRAATERIALLAWGVAKDILPRGGSFVAKLFMSPESDLVVKEIRRHFEKVSREELDSSRKTSTEYYLVANNRRS